MIYILLLVVQGVVIGLLENMAPYPFSFAPGAKLDLTNLVTIVAIFTTKKRDNFLLLWLRLFLTTLLGGAISTFFYSTDGALFSCFGVLLVKQLGLKHVSIIGISTAGGFMHNAGQLLAASFIARLWIVMSYLPVLLVLGILSGIAVRIAMNYLLRHVQILQRF